MTYNIGTQSLMALSEQELLGLYETLNSEINAMQRGGETSLITAELINRILNVIHYKRRQRKASLQGFRV